MPDQARTRTQSWVLMVLIGLIGFSLLPGVIGTGPLLLLIRADLALTYTQAGLILGTPPIVMGLMAVPATVIAARVGPIRAVGGGLFGLAVGTVLRAAAPDLLFLFTATVLLSVGAGICQPSVPVLIGHHFSRRRGLATGIYSSSITFGSMAGAMLTASFLLPLAGDFSWRGVFLVWGGLAFTTAAVWAWHGRRHPDRQSSVTTWSDYREVFLRSPFAWRIGLLFGAQGAIFYGFVSWAPALYQEMGWTVAAAAVPVTAFTLAEIPAAFLFPALVDRTARRRNLLLAGVTLCIIGLVGLLSAPASRPLLWAITIGMGTGSIFGLTVTLAVDHFSPRRLPAAMGLVLTVGSIGASIGPIVLGTVRDWTGSYTGGFLACLAIAVVMAVLALGFQDPDRLTAAAAVPPDGGVKPRPL
ncbi:MAG: MFS transporter [Thermaerobacterales bacterium]